jgi:hypothetical protein
MGSAAEKGRVVDRCDLPSLLSVVVFDTAEVRMPGVRLIVAWDISHFVKLVNYYSS